MAETSDRARRSYRREKRVIAIYIVSVFVATATLCMVNGPVHYFTSAGFNSDIFNEKFFRHRPRRFSENTILNLERGLNIINCLSAQRVAAWIYHGVEGVGKLDHWSRSEPKEKMLTQPSDTKKLTEHDTLYVSYAKLKEFVSDFLPHIQVDVVLITTPFQSSFYPDKWVTPLSRFIIDHPHVMKWFAINIGNYTGGKHHHPKVSPFPLGLKPDMGKSHYRQPMKYYRGAFLNAYNRTKTKKVFVSPLRETNPTRRAVLPFASPVMEYSDYLKEIAISEFVVSPDGDHPDCHRHYEAIGLGAVPITQLDPFLYSHLTEGGTIFANKNWNVTQLESSLPNPAPSVNRNMIFEEYWMEYVEGIVNVSLRWWDVINASKSYMKDFESYSPEDFAQEVEILWAQ